MITNDLNKKYERNKATILSMLNTDNSLHFISEELQNDESLMVFLLEKNGLYYKYLNHKNKRNTLLIKTALQQNKEVIDMLPADVLDDEKKIISLSNQSKFVLFCASPRIKNDKKVVLQCLKNCGYGYNFISQELQNDRDVIEATLREKISLALLVGITLLEEHYDYFMSVGIDYTHYLNELKRVISLPENKLLTNNIY